MGRYFSKLIYHFISLFESFVGLTCALFRFYPNFYPSVSWLIYLEVRRNRKEMEEHFKYRMFQERKANILMEDAMKNIDEKVFDDALKDANEDSNKS